jgi:hypothetical protein
MTHSTGSDTSDIFYLGNRQATARAFGETAADILCKDRQELESVKPIYRGRNYETVRHTTHIASGSLFDASGRRIS